jgi:hypothetical protein
MATKNRNSDLNVAKWQLQLMRFLPSGANEKGKSVEDLIGELLSDGTRICRDDKDKEALSKKAALQLEIDAAVDKTTKPFDLLASSIQAKLYGGGQGGLGGFTVREKPTK